MKRIFPLGIALALSGCIPPGGEYQSGGYTPRIEPDIASVNQATVNQERPVWEAHPAAGDVIEVPGGTYTVQQGDTLRSIGIKSGVGYETLMRVNELPSAAAIRTGMQLTVPAGRYHVVRAGESGIAIARAHGVHWSEIVALNALAEPYVIHTDQRLMLPAGSAAPSLTPVHEPQREPKLDPNLEARAAAFNLDDVVAGGGEPAQDVNAQPSREKPTLQRPLAPTVAVAEPTRFTGGAFSWPLNGSVVSKFSAANHGIDIAAPSGSLVNASANGVVAFTGQVAGYGGTVILRHGEGWLTIYSHLNRISVTRGAQIRRGQAIAITGGGNLHFEIRSHKTPIDPLKKLG